MESFSAWLSGLRDLHERARAGQLDPDRLSAYRTSRDELMRSLLIAQQITREYGHSARQSMRMAWALQVDLEPSRECIRAVTLDISAGGFSALLGSTPPPGRDLVFSMRLPGTTPLQGTTRVVASIAKSGNHRVSFAFASVGPDDVERLKSFLFDRVLALLVGPSGEAKGVGA
jgi:PilZ domain